MKKALLLLFGIPLAAFLQKPKERQLVVTSIGSQKAVNSGAQNGCQRDMRAYISDQAGRKRISFSSGCLTFLNSPPGSLTTSWGRYGRVVLGRSQRCEANITKVDNYKKVCNRQRINVPLTLLTGISETSTLSRKKSNSKR